MSQYPAARRLAALKAEAARSVATILRCHAAGDCRDNLIASQGDWRSKRYSPVTYSGGAPFGREGLRWFETVGLRFVGFANEVSDYIRHTGWFTREDDTGENLRGAVYQLPARNGKPMYVAGYQEIGFGVEGAAALALGETFDTPEDAASRADRIAEIHAEESRDYDRAWNAGSRWDAERETIREARKSALTLLAEMRPIRKARDGSPAICDALQATVRRYVDQIRAAREAQEELVGGYWDRDAFNEGACFAVI